MANTKYAYVRKFELPDPLLPGTFLVFRLDGHSFHRFSEIHNFTKPNDVRALNLMDHAARDLMDLHPDIILAFGESDEYSFLLKKSTTVYNRRQSKILSTLTSQFTSSYLFHWSKYFPQMPLHYPPSFDGRIILYPTEKEVKDYFAWRQADTHINNLYNTTFWALVQQGGQSTTQAHTTLRGTFSKDKHEILFSRFNINYNSINPQFRKGSVLVREESVDEDKDDMVVELPLPEVTSRGEGEGEYSVEAQPVQKPGGVPNQNTHPSLMVDDGPDHTAPENTNHKEELGERGVERVKAQPIEYIELSGPPLTTDEGPDHARQSDRGEGSIKLGERGTKLQAQPVTTKPSGSPLTVDDTPGRVIQLEATSHREGSIELGERVGHGILEVQGGSATESTPNEDIGTSVPPFTIDSTGEIGHIGSSSTSNEPLSSDQTSQHPTKPEHRFPTTKPPDNMIRESSQQTNSSKPNKKTKSKPKSKPKSTRIELYHCDLIREEFWDTRPRLFSD